MSNEYSVVLSPKTFGLSFGGVDELHGRHEGPGHTSSFEVNYVVHTARRAATSVGERFDHEITFLCDLHTQIDWCRFGEGRLLESFNSHASLDEALL